GAGGRGTDVRDPGASRLPPALGLPARERRRAGLLGGAQRAAAVLGGAASGGADRGPPHGVRNLRGTIPKDEYGGGEVSIWDAGTVEVEKWREGKEVIAVCHGQPDG